jgi:hypothetical protein
MDNFLKNITEAVDHWSSRETQPTPEEFMRQFYGNPGDPVPEVDPDDLKAVAREYVEMQKRHPGKHVAIGMGAFLGVCKPGADVKAISYRYTHVALLALLAAELVSPEPEVTAFKERLGALVKDGELTDAALNAAAKIPMTWQTTGESYDFDELLRMCA